MTEGNHARLHLLSNEVRAISTDDLKARDTILRLTNIIMSITTLIHDLNLRPEANDSSIRRKRK